MISTSDFEIWNLRFELFQQETQAVNSPSPKKMKILKYWKMERLKALYASLSFFIYHFSFSEAMLRAGRGLSLSPPLTLLSLSYHFRLTLALGSLLTESDPTVIGEWSDIKPSLSREKSLSIYFFWPQIAQIYRIFCCKEKMSLFCLSYKKILYIFAYPKNLKPWVWDKR